MICTILWAVGMENGVALPFKIRQSVWNILGKGHSIIEVLKLFFTVCKELQ
nr:hypothetical protein [Fusobacterium necrophorum]